MALEKENWRVFRVQEPVSGRWLAVARPLHERDALVAGLAAGLVLPWLMSLLLLVGLIWWAVGRGLAPLTELSQQIAGRRPDDLAPVAVDATPFEAAALVSEINLLLTRVTGALENERRFTADAAHELRTPLAAIRAQVEVAAAATDAQIRQHALKQAEKGVARATRLTEQLLTLARLDHLDAIPETGPCDLVKLAREELTDIAGKALAAGIDIALEGEVGTVHGSDELLRLALRNLIDNALAHTPPGGCVTVSVTDDAIAVGLLVQDSGEGLPTNELNRLGERFFRAGSPRPGSGLGLSIVRRIVVLHGGSLIFHSLPGLGAQLRFPQHI